MAVGVRGKERAVLICGECLDVAITVRGVLRHSFTPANIQLADDYARDGEHGRDGRRDDGRRSMMKEERRLLPAPPPRTPEIDDNSSARNVRQCLFSRTVQRAIKASMLHEGRMRQKFKKGLGEVSEQRHGLANSFMENSPVEIGSGITSVYWEFTKTAASGRETV